MKDTTEVNTQSFHRIKHAIEQMQGHTFYCENEDGALVRWTPPRPYKEPNT